MQKARAIHDREMVEKTNEIKRVWVTSYREWSNYHLLNCFQRDNLIKQHEARIAQLENVLARRIYDEVGESRFGVLADPNMPWSASAKGTDEQSNSLAVATKPQGPSSDYQPEIRGAAHEGHPTTVTHGTAEGAPVNLSISGPSSRSIGYSTFAKLGREDTDDIANFEDENPPVATGKRVMFAEVEVESSRPARRVVHLFVLSCRLSVFDCPFPLLLSSLLPFRISALRDPRVEAWQGNWGGKIGGRPGLVFSRVSLLNSSSLQVVVPDSGSGTGTGTGNKRKSAPKRR